ncbi:MAG: hypothetical protein DRJ03_03250 [Chloroflexi bacterium]|nr:MAG: hypothetical protein DRJ03_03250 [Chloroflexota bacterium]
MAILNIVTGALKNWKFSVVIERHAEATIDMDTGLYTQGTVSFIDLKANVQNATPNDMLVMDEGLRSVEAIKLYTTVEIIPVDELNKTTGDVVQYANKRWLVHNVTNRSLTGGYYKAIAIRVKNV